jgi:hypothetical protein
MTTCNADLDHPCDAGLDESPCQACQAEQAYWQAQWKTASPEEKNPAQYAQDLRDAGRGHLLPE